MVTFSDISHSALHKGMGIGCFHVDWTIYLLDDARVDLTIARGTFGHSSKSIQTTATQN